jgi:hypothetical protein
LSTLDTVAADTPAAELTSLIVTRDGRFCTLYSFPEIACTASLTSGQLATPAAFCQHQDF